MAGISGKLISLFVNGKELACQTTLALNFSVETTENPTCKPLEGQSISQASWRETSEGRRAWEATVSAQVLANALAAQNDVADLIDLYVNGSLKVTVKIATNDTSPDFESNKTMVFTGEAIMTGLGVTADGESVATGDVTFESTGAPTYVLADVVP